MGRGAPRPWGSVRKQVRERLVERCLGSPRRERGPGVAGRGKKAAARRAAGLRRTLTPREVVEPLVDLASNDYLGLARDPAVVEGAVQAEAARTWGAGSTGSRLVTGSTPSCTPRSSRRRSPRSAARRRRWCSRRATPPTSGRSRRSRARGALVVSDVAAHASLVDAARLSRARVVVARCGVPADVDAVLAAARRRPAGWWSPTASTPWTGASRHCVSWPRSAAPGVRCCWSTTRTGLGVRGADEHQGQGWSPRRGWRGSGASS